MRRAPGHRNALSHRATARSGVRSDSSQPSGWATPGRVATTLCEPEPAGKRRRPGQTGVDRGPVLAVRRRQGSWCCGSWRGRSTREAPVRLRWARWRQPPGAAPSPTATPRTRPCSGWATAALAVASVLPHEADARRLSASAAMGLQLNCQPARRRRGAGPAKCAESQGVPSGPMPKSLKKPCEPAAVRLGSVPALSCRVRRVGVWPAVRGRRVGPQAGCPAFRGAGRRAELAATPGAKHTASAKPGPDCQTGPVRAQTLEVTNRPLHRPAVRPVNASLIELLQWK